MAVRPKPTLDHLLCLDLYAASRAVIKAYGPLLHDLGLTYPQYLVMMALWEKAPLAVKDLSVRLSLDSGTLSPLLKRLEAMGLVTRTRSRDDERAVLIGLTEPGRGLEARSRGVSEGMRCLFGMSGDSVRGLQETLRGISERMEAGQNGLTG